MIRITEDDFVHGINETLKQGVKCTYESGYCSYYNKDNGHRCVVGHMARDNYHELIDSDDPVSILLEENVISSDIATEAFAIAQEIHDGETEYPEEINNKVDNLKVSDKVKEALKEFEANFNK